MDFIVHLLFEGGPSFVVVAVIHCAVFLVLWRRTGLPRWRRAFLMVVVGFGGTMILQSLVTTSREVIVDQLRTLAVAVDKTDFATIEESLDTSYRTKEHDRQSIMAAIRAKLEQHTVERPHLGGFAVKIEGDRAEARFNARCDLRVGGTLMGNVPSEWLVIFVRRDGEWKVQSIEALRIGGRPASGLGDVSW